ncbi:hypothetical protein J5571_00390 [Streptococcus suis]|uniref:hypothetical protein n=1 Tax=Streptococcus suis TaxID=1307 RepID=UPI000CF3B0CA|nr:hypothetical protein [Streptococcus suis]MBO4115001.1 hypothetical protein [Streptococcus suis]MBO4117119.1 hypothetical protein [Streptococcus suis]MBO4124400.1 hypothetical protein [Streptococcus suis]MBO4128192.1 hypothetical protein [Streptococcus suis]
MQETKRPRGRPATGRVRDKKITLQVTENERERIKKYALENNITVTDLLIAAVEKQVTKKT